MATAEKTKKDPLICSKEGCDNPRALPGSTSPWCKEHRAEYARNYDEASEWRARRLGGIEGIRLMRQEIANYFHSWGGRPFMGAEVASIVSSLPGPAVADETAKPQ